jgi:predicted regulator of Ras-like GTPase activity (Roadblock/LC7/MglB family)
MALVGNLRDLKLPNLIQLNCMEKNTAKLTIEYAGKYGFVYFQDGNVVHAELDPEVGEEALFRMLALQEGKFRVENGVRPPVISITTPWNSLLLKGLHHLDTLQISDESRHLHLLSMLMNIKGVRNTALINAEGNILASNTRVDAPAVLAAFTTLQVEKIGTLMGRSNPRYVSLSTDRNRILLAPYKQNIVYLDIEAKYQLDTILALIGQVLDA